MIRLSIIIPSWNEEGHLGRLLKSIHRQSFQDYEIIVSDARSTDGTREVARRYGARIISGGMPGAGRNAGVRAAHANLLLFLDADAALPSKHFLRDTLKEMRRRRLDIASVRVAPDGDGVIDRLFHWIYNRYTGFLIRFVPHATGACIFSKRHIHDSVGGFDETITFAEDQDYVRRGSAVGDFGILKAHPIIISVRRLEKEGRFAFALKYLRAEWRILTRRPIRNNEIPYDLRDRS